MKGVIVNSHERSGTHFLMNTLADNFGYRSYPFINLDCPGNLIIPKNIIYAINNLVEKDDGRTIIKSHYNGRFFQEIIDEINKHYHVFYIYRNSDDVMKSLCKHYTDFNRETDYNGGPICKTAKELSKAEPWGGCIRYQYQQYPTMLDRHLDHIKSWMKLPYVKQISYKDLNEQFNETVYSISEMIDMPLFHGSPIRPSKARTVQNGIFNDKEALKV